MSVRERHDTPNGERRLADIVHALKNPLAGVRGALQLVCSRLPPSREREILRTALARLADVDAMLDQLSGAHGGRSGAHAIELEPHDVPALAAKRRERRSS